MCGHTQPTSSPYPIPTVTPTLLHSGGVVLSLKIRWLNQRLRRNSSSTWHQRLTGGLSARQRPRQASKLLLSPFDRGQIVELIGARRSLRSGFRDRVPTIVLKYSSLLYSAAHSCTPNGSVVSTLSISGGAMTPCAHERAESNFPISSAGRLATF